VLGNATRRHVAAGPLVLHLHLNRAKLKRLAGKHKKLAILIRVMIIVPTKAIPAGVLIPVTKQITLTRH
jgi:hypothetical protein